MKVSIIIGRLLAICLIAGLVFAPFSGPANAAMDVHLAMPAAVTATSADMPCCPDNPGPVDCGQCPLMALCMATAFHQPSTTGVVEIGPIVVRLMPPSSDPAAESLNTLPPPKPPRSLVHSA